MFFRCLVCDVCLVQYQRKFSDDAANEMSEITMVMCASGYISWVARTHSFTSTKDGASAIVCVRV